MEMNLGKGKQLTRKTMRLKDYLLDELSSCSSSGFRSYPRRQQCSTTVRLDLKNKPQHIFKKSSSISVIQRASNALFNAVKHLPFSSSCRAKNLPRKLLNRCFSRKNGINAIEKKCRSPEMISITTTGSNSRSSIMSESYSWSGSDFTVSDEYLQCSSEVKHLNEISSVENNGQVNHKIAAAIDGGDYSVEAASDSSSSSSKIVEKTLRNGDEKKLQLSPVSVLDCPFQDDDNDDEDDDEDEVSSPFQPTIAPSKGSNTRQIMKNCIKNLEPINLEKRIALSAESDQDSSTSPFYASSQSKPSSSSEEKEAAAQSINTECKLINVDENLLFDFFEEEIEIGQQHTQMGLTHVACDNNELLNKANDWLKGQPRELVLEGEVKKSMETCLRDMEREGKWKTCDADMKEIVLELESEVFASLVEELLYDH